VIFKLIEDEQGKHWVKQWIDYDGDFHQEALPSNESITFDPNEHRAGTEVFLAKAYPPPSIENSMPFEEFLKEIEETVPLGEFKPGAFYNRAGDLIQVYLSNEPNYGEYINEHITLMYAAGEEEKRIVGYYVENIKTLLLKAYRSDTPNSESDIE